MGEGTRGAGGKRKAPVPLQAAVTGMRREMFACEEEEGREEAKEGRQEAKEGMNSLNITTLYHFQTLNAF